jgi:hypothetical protein
MIQRMRTLQQTGIFLKENPGKAHLTIDELHEMAASDNSAAFISKVSRYVANIAGSNAYWHRVKEDLKAIITSAVRRSCRSRSSAGAPAVFPTPEPNFVFPAPAK